MLENQPPTKWNAHIDQLTGGKLKGVIASAVLINDFVSVGYGQPFFCYYYQSNIVVGIPALPKESIQTLHDAPTLPRAPISCVGAGSGLGAVFLTWEGDDTGHYKAWPSEGGMNQFQGVVT